MPDTAHPDSDHDKTSEAFKKDSQFGLWWVVFAVAILTIILLLVSIFQPYLTERVKFFTGTWLSLLVLVVIVIQTYIYRRQWEAMQEQLTTMHDQADSMRESLKETRVMVEQNQQAVEAARQGAEIAQQNMICAQRAYVTIASVGIISAGKVAPFNEEETGITSSDEVASFRLKLKLENSGNTPANNVEIFHTLEAGDFPPTPSKDAPRWTQIGLIAPHGFGYSYGDRLYEDDINWEILEGKDMGRGIYCWGVLRYRDIFGQTWHTIFNYVQSPQDHSLDSLSPFYPSPSGGNEAE